MYSLAFKTAPFCAETMLLGTGWTSWLPASVLTVFVLFSPTKSDTDCFPEAPRNCTFKTGFCNWTEHNWSLNTNKYAFLSVGNLSGSLSSRVVCVNTSVSHCLRFQYYLKSDHGHLLSVSISWSHNVSELQLWNTSTHTDWAEIEIAVHSDSSFQVLIEGKRTVEGNKKRIRVRNLRYDKTGCASEVTSTSTSIGITSRTGVQTTEAVPSGTRTTSVTGNYVTFTTLPDTLSTLTLMTPVSPADSTQGMRGTADSSSDVGTIVGAVLAVIIFVCLTIFVIIVFFFRRNHMVCWKVQSEDETTADQSSPDKDRAYHGLSDNSHAEIDVTPLNRYSALNEARMSRLSMEVYSVIRDEDQNDQSLDAFQLRSSLYCLAQGIATGTDNPSAADSLEDPYEIGDDERVPQLRDDPENEDYNELSFDKRDGGVVDEAHIYSNDTPYDHIHTTDTSDDGKKMAPYEEIERRAITEASHQQIHERGFDNTCEDRTPQKLQGKTSDTHHIFEEIGNQKPHTESPSLYQLAGDTTTQTPGTQPTSIPEDSTSQNPHAKTTQEVHLDEDTMPQNPDFDTKGTYHIMEETHAQRPPTATAENYHTVEDPLREDPKSSQSATPEFAPFPREADSDYNNLDFNRGGTVEPREGRGGDGVYSHLKEGGEDTYDEVIRDRKVEIIDQDYSHIQ